MTKKLVLPMEKYLSSGIRIGSKFKTKFMEEYVYKIRSDGLALFNANKIDRKIRVLINFLASFEPGEIFVVCRREAGWNSLEMLNKATGIHAIPGRYLPGTITNPGFEFYKEAKVLFVCDPWLDKNAIKDGLRANIPIIAICDTNNTTNDVDLVVPANNKGKQSLATMFWVIAKEYLLEKKAIKDESEFEYSVEDFMGKE